MTNRETAKTLMYEVSKKHGWTPEMDCDLIVDFIGHIEALLDKAQEKSKAAVQAAYCVGWYDMGMQGVGFQEEPPVFLPAVQRRLAALVSAGGTEEEQ